MRAQHHLTPTWLALTGPTACGKSGVAMRLAQDLPLEIVSVDSALVYRGMDIGTAKPTAAQRQTVVHHLIDIEDPGQPYSAARFAADCARAIRQIRARGAQPLLVGGTMLYLKALAEGLSDLPPADPLRRADIDARAARNGWPALHAELTNVDPVTAMRIAPHDGQRIQRALEVFYASGQPMSALIERRAAGQPVELLSLEPSDRATLHRRIADRFDQMLHAGLLDEVARLRTRADLHARLPSMRSVGYRQCWAYLDGAIDAAQLRDQAISATRQLAKRQLTWLRALERRTVIDCLAADFSAQALRAIARFYGATAATDGTQR